MRDIHLKVPEGDYCLGCMFLEVDYHHNNAHCKLFNVHLYYNMQYGGIEESTIRKVDSCPTEE